MPSGRPPFVPSDEFIEDLCAMICEGKTIPKAMAALKAAKKPYPVCTERLLYQCLGRDGEAYERLRDAYDRAMEVRLVNRLDRMHEIADGPGPEEDSPVRVNRDRVRLENMRWEASKLIPRYRDRQELDVNVLQGSAERMQEMRKRDPGPTTQSD